MTLLLSITMQNTLNYRDSLSLHLNTEIDDTCSLPTADVKSEEKEVYVLRQDGKRKLK